MTDRHIVFPQPKTYCYRLGDDLFVHPVMHNAKESKEVYLVFLILTSRRMKKVNLQLSSSDKRSKSGLSAAGYVMYIGYPFAS
jgi:hypothetical protein